VIPAVNTKPSREMMEAVDDFWSGPKGGNTAASSTPAAESKPSASTKAAPVNSSATSSSDSGEVSGMTRDLSDWCIREVTKLTGKGDLTLMKLLMTFDDPSEIRMYTSTYYGSTPAVSAFTTEFIKRKNDMKRPSSKVPVKSSEGDKKKKGKK